MARFGISLSSSSDDESPPQREGWTAKRSVNVGNESARTDSPRCKKVHSADSSSATFPAITGEDENVPIGITNGNHVVVSPQAQPMSNDVGSAVLSPGNEGINDDVDHIIKIPGVDEDGGLEKEEIDEEKDNIVLVVTTNEEDSGPGDGEEENAEIYAFVYSPVSEEEESRNTESVAIQYGVKRTHGTGLTADCVSGYEHDFINPNPSPPRTEPTGRLTFTPLQKWEYENGYPVYGVPDTRQWAIDVGLNVGNNDPEAQQKRRKLASAEAPPKYVASLGLNVLSPDDEMNPGSPSENPEEDVAEKAKVSRKGKEKVE